VTAPPASDPDLEQVAWDLSHLLDSGAGDPHFVVEVEDSGRARLRFGDGTLGRRPRIGSELRATYRVGNGREGNVGRDTLTRAVRWPADGPALPTGLEEVRNPLPASGGTDPQPMEEARLHAPHAFRRQERAVTEDDYARAAERHAGVQRAAATRRWTGSWHTMFVTVDRRGGAAITPEFEAEMRAHLDAFRLAGYDVEVDAPRFVPLDVALWVCVEAHHVRADVHEALLELFSARELPGGRRGLFHPDHLTFGQTVYLSPLIAAAMRVPGVGRVEARRFQRWREPDDGELDLGRIEMARLEIARLDNDPNAPENGRLELQMEGGL
jgi:predicted phage baseplate assembly protein